jgi:hypothetical protein
MKLARALQSWRQEAQSRERSPAGSRARSSRGLSFLAFSLAILACYLSWLHSAGKLGQPEVLLLPHFATGCPWPPDVFACDVRYLSSSAAGVLPTEGRKYEPRKWREVSGQYWRREKPRYRKELRRLKTRDFCLLAQTNQHGPVEVGLAALSGILIIVTAVVGNI